MAARADVSYTTICRIERDQVDPSTGTLEKVLWACGQDLVLDSKPIAPSPELADLSSAWHRAADGTDQPDWTKLRAFLDFLVLNRSATRPALRPQPAGSGSAFFDSLLAGIAEVLADREGIPRPAWTRKVPPLEKPWRSPGTPAMRAAHTAGAPPQLLARGIHIPVGSLWR